MLAASLVMVGLTKGVPDLVQSLINGTAFAGGGGLLGAAAAAGGAVGGGSAVAGAARLASEQLASQGGSGGGSPASRPAAFAAAVARNLGGAAVADVGARLGGRAHFGNVTGRMASDLHSRATTARAEREHRDARAEGAGAPGTPRARTGPTARATAPGTGPRTVTPARTRSGRATLPNDERWPRTPTTKPVGAPGRNGTARGARAG